MKRTFCLIVIFSLYLPEILLLGCMPSSDSPPPGTTLTSTSTAVSTVPTTVPPTTEVTNDSDQYIGTLYTKDQLAAFDNEMHSFGCGRYYTAQRPPYSVASQTEFADLNVAFIGEDNPSVYLTFDCGYEYQNHTADILDTLKEKNVKAVFFVTMYYCETQPQLVQRMIDEGHTLGNHSNNHYDLPNLDINQAVYEIMSLHEYVKNNFQYEMTLFRPPCGRYSARSLAITQSLGYQSVFWSFAYRDWETESQPDTEDAFHTVTSCAHNGCIYLLHAVSSANAEILGDVIDDLRNRGYTLELFQ